MIIIGAGGFAKEIFEIYYRQNCVDSIVFYDDINIGTNRYVFDKFPILENEIQVIDHFKERDNTFVIGVGGPHIRHGLYKKFTALGGTVTSCISSRSDIASFDVDIKKGCNILSGSVISAGTRIGICCLIYYNSIVAHDSIIGDFVEISPNATILGRCTIGSFVHVGASATILPDITIGTNVIIGAGSVVTKDIPDNSLAYGAPASVKRKLE